MKGYVTRDKNGSLTLFTDKPFKQGNIWVAGLVDIVGEIENSDLPEGINPKWEDAEPIEINIKIEKL